MSTKDKHIGVMVRMTPEQLRALDEEVERQRHEPGPEPRVTRALVLRRALFAMLNRKQAA